MNRCIAGNKVIPKGVRLTHRTGVTVTASSGDKRQTNRYDSARTFSLYMKVSLYAAICVSVPFLLLQIWGFVSPGLYPHERAYVTPFIALSSISFVLGAAFAYYVIFPPAAKYLLGLGSDFRLLLKADDYFDFIIIVMLGMGVVFQMPAITYVLARIGLVTAGLMLKNMENCTNRHPDQRRGPVPNQRHSKHDVVRGSDDGSLRNFDLHCLDFQQTSNDDLNASNYTSFARFLGNWPKGHRILTVFSAGS